ncbi:MAG TPA: MBL fold metallo-hydrolase [Bacteriovoracaceae bacterium]|nr:MBL fold metallo-hydrolase [Bacteriovoracaceae bacterium]
MNRITILGSGTSTGVPILGCKCKVCQSTEIRNKRFRTSAVIELHNKKNLLIDASPDLRTQLLRSDFDSIDGVILTHNHADHTHGIDDLRAFSFLHGPLPVFADSFTGESLKTLFPYIFDTEKYFGDKPILGGGIPQLHHQLVSPGKSEIFDNVFELFHLPHGHAKTLGILHQKMAYVVDCKEIPPEFLGRLKAAQLELLIIDCLRPEPHQTHLHFDLTLEYIKEISPRLAILTHMGHEWDYLDLLQQLRLRGVKNVLPAIDGQSFLYSNS